MTTAYCQDGRVPGKSYKGIDKDLNASGPQQSSILSYGILDLEVHPSFKLLPNCHPRKLMYMIIGHYDH